MNNLAQLSRKFAMKLGLESGHSVSSEPIFDLKTEFVPVESGEFESVHKYPKDEETEPYISNESLESEKKANRLYWVMREMQAHFHGMKEMLDLGDFQKAWDEAKGINDALRTIKAELEKKMQEQAA